MTTKLITGITPSRVRGNSPQSSGATSYPIASGAGAMYTGTPVRLSGGSLVPLVTSTGNAYWYIPRLQLRSRRGAIF